MIAQHVYSRCMEGYFSKTAAIADSTTVTMRVDAFRRQEQAKEIAQKCEDISTLEDTRPVPDEFSGVYRGVLKIRRINRQLTLICRSYRLHSDQNSQGGRGGEFRDFTYSTNYLISGEDKEQFLANPESCLALQDFEPYPSIVKRIQESYRLGKNGRIEASEEYSLFHHDTKEASFQVFQKAGFTRELFIDYISGILHRISNSHYAGHGSEKVLVVLPKQFNTPWEASGGNPYAEEVLVATLKLLPSFVAGQLNATTGGRTNPDASVLDGYHLVFMENAPTREWVQKGYYVIDLENQQSYLPENLDTNFASFLWNNLNSTERIQSFLQEYVSIFGDGDVDHSPEKFTLVMQLLRESNSNFADVKTRSHLLSELVGYSEESGWYPKGIALAQSALRQESMAPTNNPMLEKELLAMLSGEEYPEELKNLSVEILVQDTYKGSAEDDTVSFIYELAEKEDLTVLDKISRANKSVLANTATKWYENESLMDFYTEVLRSSKISGSQNIKKEILEILTGWHRIFLEQGDWGHCSQIVSILAEHLEDEHLPMESRQEIYRSLFYLVYYGNESGMKDALTLIKKEEKKNASNPECLIALWNVFKSYGMEYKKPLGSAVIGQMVYFAVGREERFLEGEWEPLYQHFAEISVSTRSLDALNDFRRYFEQWEGRLKERAHRSFFHKAMYLAEWSNMEIAGKWVKTDLSYLRKLLSYCREENQVRKGAELLYKRYQLEQTVDAKRNFFANELNTEERCLVEMQYQLTSQEDPILDRSFMVFQDEEVRDGILRTIDAFDLSKPDEVANASDKYFTLVKAYGETKRIPDNLHNLCQYFGREMQKLQSCSLDRTFYQTVQKGIHVYFGKQEPRRAVELQEEDVLLLKNMGVLPLGTSWEGLDTLVEFLELPDNTVTEEFISMRHAMIKCQDWTWKEVYLHFLERKCEHLRADKHSLEYLLNVALLAEQMYEEKTGSADFDLNNITQLSTGALTHENRLGTAMSMLAVIKRYLDQRYNDEGVYGLTPARKTLLMEILRASKQNPRLFADDLMLKKYIQLSREDKAILEKNGFRREIRELPKEWQEKYGVKKQQSASEVVVPLVVGGILLVLGIAAVVVFSVLYSKIGSHIGNIVGMSLVAAGFLGTVITMIFMLLSGGNDQDFM
ncbi:MAG: hypothetical protein Q4B26_10605 [Eubacteriales bacterium]|nr:hypothetical protein [Eubacteriales bacterium]